MEKYIYRFLALVALILNMNSAKAGLSKFVYRTDGDMLSKSDIIGFVVNNKTNNLTVVANRSYYKDFLYQEISARLGETIDDTKFIELVNSGRFKMAKHKELYGFKNTGWDKTTGTAKELLNPTIWMEFWYWCLDGEPLIKANCGNIIIKINKKTPVEVKTKHAIQRYVPCLKRLVDMSIEGQYSADSNFYLHSDGDWYYFTGIYLDNGKRKFEILTCEPKQPVVKNDPPAPPRENNPPPPPVTTNDGNQAPPTMGRMYYWYQPQMPTQQFRQRATYVSINIDPSAVMWMLMPGIFNQRLPVYRGFYQGRPVMSVGNPMDGGQIYYPSPFDQW